MSQHNIQFQNRAGITLSARLDLPEGRKPHNYAIFAHCFTCTKNLMAVKHIAKGLNDEGIAVLRFDFTGLGDSEGAFETSNFSSNINDLVDAANYLASEYQPATLLIGHSLGGAAVVFAAAELDHVQAVATIGAPAAPDHVAHLFAEDIPALEDRGEVQVDIGGRPFTIQKQFLDDLRAKNMKAVLRDLRKPVLVMHSPQDKIVGIENAREIYAAAHHPKSYISLDGADHLLTNQADARYAGSVIGGWAVRYLETEEPPSLETAHEVAVYIGNQGYTTQVQLGKHQLTADEPQDVGGADLGPSPYQLISAGLGTCTAMTLRMYADRKKWPLEGVVVHINHGKRHCEDCEELDRPSGKIDHFDRKIELKGELSDEQRKRLLEIADKCPVHKTLHQTSAIHTVLAD